MSKRVWTVGQVRELGVATDVETAASVLGIGRTTAYTLARSGEFPAPVIRVGERYVVSGEGLLTVLCPGDAPQALDARPLPSG
ncbi:helix-turn-helix domain-containing protein [Actinoplanes nipponensis]|uniref:helix-turn-helix domain-containing protein n=1 Tax=Actinoplanes nipponensis TaxID=135950 RepID=UPI00194462CB|nr:helix-turn-helix domain-containing protein [Actinoplanes nipponensis]